MIMHEAGASNLNDENGGAARQGWPSVAGAAERRHLLYLDIYY